MSLETSTDKPEQGLQAWQFFVLAGLAYGYLVSAFVGLAWSRLRHRGGPPIADAPAKAPDQRDSAAR